MDQLWKLWDAPGPMAPLLDLPLIQGTYSNWWWPTFQIANPFKLLTTCNIFLGQATVAGTVYMIEWYFHIFSQHMLQFKDRMFILATTRSFTHKTNIHRKEIFLQINLNHYGTDSLGKSVLSTSIPIDDMNAVKKAPVWTQASEKVSKQRTLYGKGGITR